MAKAFRNGDYRAGYYRDQTFMMASGLLTVQEFFAQLYAHPDVEADPSSAGRSMNGHFGTRMLDENGSVEGFDQEQERCLRYFTHGRANATNVSPSLCLQGLPRK